MYYKIQFYTKIDGEVISCGVCTKRDPEESGSGI